MEGGLFLPEFLICLSFSFFCAAKRRISILFWNLRSAKSSCEQTMKWIPKPHDYRKRYGMPLMKVNFLFWKGFRIYSGRDLKDTEFLGEVPQYIFISVIRFQCVMSQHSLVELGEFVNEWNGYSLFKTGSLILN